MQGENVKTNPDDSEPYDHVQKVQNAQQGMMNEIERINRELGAMGNVAPSEERVAELLEQLAGLSRLLDHSRESIRTLTPSEDDGEPTPDGGGNE